MQQAVPAVIWENQPATGKKKKKRTKEKKFLELCCLGLLFISRGADLTKCDWKLEAFRVTWEQSDNQSGGPPSQKHPPVFRNRQPASAKKEHIGS